MNRRETVPADATVVVVPNWTDFDSTINEAADIARVMMLVIEGGLYAGELAFEECEAAVRVANQLVDLTAQVKADFEAFHTAGIFTRSEEAAS